MLVNSSNDSLPGIFPYWQPTLAISLFGSIIVPSGVVIFLYIPLLVVLLKLKDNFKSLNVIHMSLLISSIIDDILLTCLRVVYFPSIYQRCVCSDVVGTMFVVLGLSFPTYQAFAFACLALLQFLVIRGKLKRFNTLKAACCMITLSFGVSLVFIGSLVRELHDSNERAVCFDAFCPNSRPESGISNLIVVLISVFCGAYIPSIVVVVITSTWSCVLFKHYYTGGDDQLNRRMLSFPVVMMLAIIASKFLEILLLQIVGEVLMSLSLGVYLPYWTLFAQFLAAFLLRIVTRLTYPLVLVYTHARLRRAIKKYLIRLKTMNSVAPSTTTTSSNQ